MGQGTSGGRRPGGIKDRQLDRVQGTRWEASNAQREIPAFTLQHSEAKGKFRTTEPYREGGHFTKLPGASAELREEKRPGRRCCRQWGGLSSWERKGVQDRVLEQTGKGDAMLDKEGHGGEGAREDNAAQWQAGRRQPRRTGAWCWFLPGAQLQAKQAAHTTQSPQCATREPQAQGGPGEAGFPARKAGTGFKEPAAGERWRLVLTGRHPFLLFNCQTPLQSDRFVLCN